MSKWAEEYGGSLHRLKIGEFEIAFRVREFVPMFWHLSHSLGGVLLTEVISKPVSLMESRYKALIGAKNWLTSHLLSASAAYMSDDDEGWFVAKANPIYDIANAVIELLEVEGGSLRLKPDPDAEKAWPFDKGGALNSGWAIRRIGTMAVLVTPERGSGLWEFRMLRQHEKRAKVVGGTIDPRDSGGSVRREALRRALLFFQDGLAHIEEPIADARFYCGMSRRDQGGGQ